MMSINLALIRPPNPLSAKTVLKARKTNMGHLVPSKAGAAWSLARVLDNGGNVGITEQNLSLLKSGKVKGIRFSTLEKICERLDCQPGDILFYRIALLRSVLLYVDDAGVWVHAGVLPWKKGVTGVKWRDVDEATYAQGFWSWLTRSYLVRIGHRFTKSNEIVLTNIGGGKHAVGLINARHQAIVRAGLDE